MVGSEEPVTSINVLQQCVASLVGATVLNARSVQGSRILPAAFRNNNCCGPPILAGHLFCKVLAPEASFPMTRILLGASLCLTLLLSGWPAAGVMAQRPAPRGPASLDGMVARAVRDTNGDGLADLVAARVILPQTPTAEEIEGAANLAARLAFETSALSLPIVVRVPDVTRPAAVDLPILVGRENPLVVKVAAAEGFDLKSLKPGQGLIAVVQAPLGGPDGLLVAGGDGAGTLAAANHLASRLPRLWGMSGVTLRLVDEQTTGFLKSRGIAAGAASVSSILVDSDRRGLANVTVRVQVPAGDAARAERALADLDLAHRRGLEPRTLNYSDVAETTVDLRTGDRSAARASVRRSGLNARTLTPPIDPDELAPDSPGDRGRPADTPEREPSKSFDLTDVYSISGWFGDAYTDLIPDRTETAVLLGDATDSFGAVHIAARLGLESTGVTLPIARPASKVRDAAREPNPILVGRANPLVADLIKIGKTRLDDLQPGEGAIHIVPRAFGNATATVVAGADAAGSEAAAMYLARRVPYVWETARGSLTTSDVATDLSRFLSARSGAGQASLAMGELDAIAKELKDKKLQSAEVKLYLEAGDRALETYLASRLKEQLANTTVTVTTQGITDPVPVFDETIEVPWEVEEFWTRFRADVLPRVRPGVSVDVEARLSESPEYRRTVADQVRAELTTAGAAQPRVRILSAYKQGFLWLTEQVIPQLKGKGVTSVRIKVLAHKPDLTKDYKFHQVPSRWLKELYPVDEFFARELGGGSDAFQLELVDEATDIYTVEALDAGGQIVQRLTFSPKFVEREYLDKFPGWARVEVTTGWLLASVDGATVADVRIATDPERFWDQYQSKMLPRIYDHVMKVTDNKPTPAKQPFHRDLDIEIRMSEPDFRIGVDEELVSSLESLHEDLYFVTLDFFSALGRTTTRQRLAGPGKIFPIVHPERRGQPGTVRVLYAGNAATQSRLEVSYREEGVERPGRIARDLAKVDSTPPAVVRAVVRDDGVRALELQVEAKDDAQATRAVDALDALGRLHAAGLYRTSLSYAHVDRVAVSIVLKEARTRRVVAHTGSAAPSNVLTAGARPPTPVVTWDHVISPDESEEIVGKLSAYPEIKAYKAGRSYRGRDISVMEITLPTASELVSLAKLTTLKPTIFITGRQHANEVSSTSHILRLGELLVTDPVHVDPEAGQRRAPPSREPRRRADGVRPAEAHAHAHAARRPLQRARHGRGVAGGHGGPAAAGIARARARLAGVAAGYLPEPARLPVARVGTAIRRLRAARLPQLLVVARLVYRGRRAARSALSRSRRGGGSAARRHRPRDQHQRRRQGDEPAASGALPPLGIRIRAVRVQPGDLQGHGDLLHRPRDRRATRQPARGRVARRRRRRRSFVDERVATGDVRVGRDGSTGRNRPGRVAEPRHQAGLLLPDGAPHVFAGWAVQGGAHRGGRAARRGQPDAAARAAGHA